MTWAGTREQTRNKGQAHLPKWPVSDWVAETVRTVPARTRGPRYRATVVLGTPSIKRGSGSPPRAVSWLSSGLSLWDLRLTNSSFKPAWQIWVWNSGLSVSESETQTDQFQHRQCFPSFRVRSNALWGFPDSSAGKESTCNAGDLGSIPGLGRSPGEGTGYPLQCSGLENSMDCIVYGVSKSRTRLSDFCFHWCFAEPLVGHLFLPFSRKQAELRCDLKLSWDATWSYAELVMSLMKSAEPVSPSKHQGPTGWRKRSQGEGWSHFLSVKGTLHGFKTEFKSTCIVVFLKETAITSFPRNCWLIEEIWKHLSHSF